MHSAEAARASDAQEHNHSLAVAEAQLEEKHALLTRAEEWVRQLEADLAIQETGHQAMEGALTGNFLALLSFNHVCSVIS